MEVFHVEGVLPKGFVTSLTGASRHMDMVKQLSLFLPVPLINRPSFKPEVFFSYWDTENQARVARLRKQVKSDISRIDKIWREYGRGSQYLTESDLAKTIGITKNQLEHFRTMLEKLVGGTDSRRYAMFESYRALALTKLQLERIGVHGTDSCIWATAFAVHLGNLPVDKPPVSLAPNTDFIILNQNKSPDNRVRARLVTRIRACCNRYMNHIDSLDLSLFVPKLGAIEDTSGGISPAYGWIGELALNARADQRLGRQVQLKKTAEREFSKRRRQSNEK